jgi:hypothetical protein
MKTPWHVSDSFFRVRMVRTRRAALLIFLYLLVFKGNYLINAFAVLAVYSM